MEAEPTKERLAFLRRISNLEAELAFAREVVERARTLADMPMFSGDWGPSVHGQVDQLRAALRKHREASSYSLDAAYCPSCGSPLREHTNDDCAACGYHTGREETWLTLREMIEGKAGEDYPLSDNVNLPLFARIVAEAVGREKNDV